ncbi:putative membrane-bound dehydrogenase domain-containing protein [Neorhodopirellula lusitana]|uniref:Membrane-bound dehydrogenase domain-containing protein n=2 Tax=Neorhodopirellula lusitana TaxID=445327 RepID=A0ABY1Q3D2_9BACT|nr:putative membrane-bound dehydrogenase domain-containing protein [Neorhodopirellula lusitana]
MIDSHRTNLMMPRLLARILVCTALLAVSPPAIAENADGIKIVNLKGANLDLMNNHDPESERENFELLPGYQVNLFASDPMLANPVHMQWDSRGRLWVACSWAYPQLKPGEKANDKIIILEDTDDDGVADKSTVFADGLYLPTGIELANGGCFVAQSPDVFFLKDTDGDDVADVKELVLTGFGIEDSHHSISAWRRGPGGWIYFQEGIFLHSQVETQHGVVRNFNGGVYQLNPRTQELRMFCRGTGGNPWGHVFDRWGQSFMVNNPRIMYLSPASGNSGEAVRIRELIKTDKQCGGDLATGTHIADDLRGQLLTGRFKSRMVVRYEFIENGAGFSCNVLPPLMTSKHPNFRPVDVKVGPRGAIYVADWYNSIINHANHDFRDPRRDHEHGRIWRITHKERPLTPKPVLMDRSIESLVDQLQSPETWTRHQARKELSERDPDKVLAAAENWIDQLDPNDTAHDHHLVEAMWACQNVERVSEKILTQVLNAKDGHARSAGARTLRYWHDQLSDPISLIAKTASDPFPRTRMEGVLSAGFIPQADALTAALQSLDHPGDPILDQALPQTMKALESLWRPALEAGTLSFADPAHRQYVQRDAGIGLDESIADLFQNQSPTDKEIAGIQAQLIRIGTESDVQLVLNEITKGNANRAEPTTVAMLETLEQLARSKWPRNLHRRMRALGGLLDHKNKQIAVLAARNLGEWKMAGRKELALLDDSSLDAYLRQTLAISLAKTSPKYGGALAKLAEGSDTKDGDAAEGDAQNGDTQIRSAAIMGLAYTDLNRATEIASNLFTHDLQDVDPVPIVRAILKQQNGATQLASSLENVDIHPAVKAKVSQYHRMSGKLPNNLAERFQPSTTQVSLSAQLLAEDQDQLTQDVVNQGDAARGEMIFRRKALSCVNCHAIGPAGPTIGPNLVAVGSASKPGYLVESILKPNAAIAEHYENRMFLLADGSIQTGIVTFQNEHEFVVRDAAEGGKEVRLDVEEIEFERAQPSAMPAGLADQLGNRTEFLDLAKFMTVLGTPGDFANDESPVIRRWRLTAANQDAPIPSKDATWIPQYSKVNGELPAIDFPTADKVFARGEFNVLVGGKLQLDVNDTSGLKLWIDDQPTESATAPMDLAPGLHSLTFAIDTTVRKDVGLRVELKAIDRQVKFQPQGGQ